MIVYLHLSGEHMTLLRCLAATCAIGSCMPAWAHITTTFPAERAGTVSVTEGPCGTHTTPGRGPARKFLPGQTVDVRWTEVIDHPGHYRISFDDDGQDDFVDPAGYDDFYVSESVLLDNIPDLPNQSQYLATITLPNIECDNCTLQVMQVNTDKPPFTPSPLSNDMHWTCADITLTPDAEILLLDGFE